MFLTSWSYSRDRNEIGTLRSPTATSTKTSSQNITLVYHKSFVIVPSWSSHILLAKYPENELVRDIFKVKKENERFSVVCSRCRQNLKFGGFTSSLCRGSQKYLLNSVRHVQHDYLWSFNQWYHCFVALLLPSPSSFLKLPSTTFTTLFKEPLDCQYHHRIPCSTPCVGGVHWLSNVHREVFPSVIRFSPLITNDNF